MKGPRDERPTWTFTVAWDYEGQAPSTFTATSRAESLEDIVSVLEGFLAGAGFGPVKLGRE